jgi:hypothetical protein
VTPYLSYRQLSRHGNVELNLDRVAHRRLLDKRSAIGAAGSMMVSHVLDTSTSRMALRETFFRFDFEPSVATSLASERSVSTRRGRGHEKGAIPDGCDAIFARRENCASALVRVVIDGCVDVSAEFTFVAVEHFADRTVIRSVSSGLMRDGERREA